MSLLTRIARSNGNKQRKIQANFLISALDQSKIAYWNKNLEAEIPPHQCSVIYPSSCHISQNLLCITNQDYVALKRIS